jgi:hypothetical protein
MNNSPPSRRVKSPPGSADVVPASPTDGVAVPATGGTPDRPPGAREEFVCEEIAPAAGTFDTAGMSRGEPGLPGRFTWRGREYRVVGVVRQWKTSGPCRDGSPELYLRRHWYQIVTEPRATMTVYCDRQAKDRKKPKRRWWVYTVSA